MRNSPDNNPALRVGSRTLLLGLCLGLAACANPGDKETEKYIYAAGRPVQQRGDAQSGVVVESIWEGGEYGHVRIVEAEAAAGRNSHPVNLSSAQLSVGLEQIQVEKSRGKTAPLLNEDQLDALTERLAEALAKAQPDQDVTFAVTARKGGLSLLSPLSVTTGRVFFKDGALNVIFGLVDTPFESELRASGVLRPFTPGSRSSEASIGPTLVTAGGARFGAGGRRDWIEIASGGLAAAPAPASGLQYPQFQAPGAPVSGLQSLTPVDEGTFYSENDTRYRELEKRLRVLQRLRQQNLISDEEYQAKRRVLINEL